MASPVYPSDLSDDEWVLLAPLIPAAKPGQRAKTLRTLAGSSRRQVPAARPTLPGGQIDPLGSPSGDHSPFYWQLSWLPVASC